MIYAYCYLAIGVVILAVIYGSHHLSKKRESNFVRDFKAALNLQSENLFQRILKNLVVPVLAAILVVSAWPIAIYMQVKALIDNKKKKMSSTNGAATPRISFLDANGTDEDLKANGTIEEQKEFAIEQQHLQELLTIQEIEKREIVTDPLKAVPELPFGHLHEAWQKFLKDQPDDGELWSFSARTNRTLREGYVMIKGGALGAYFLTVLCDAPMEM